MKKAKLPKFLGPHEGRELELMRLGKKPLSMFLEEIAPRFKLFPEEEFDDLVTAGKLIKKVSIKGAQIGNGNHVKTRRVLYALANETWRMDAYMMTQDLYDSLRSGWHPDLDRLIGLLLGYRQIDIEQFIRRHEK